MGTPYPLEKKNQILGRILSKEITVEQAHREYSIATSCVYRWLRQLKADSSSGLFVIPREPRREIEVAIVVGLESLSLCRQMLIR